MARVKYIDLIDDYRGKLNTPKAKDGVIIVFRQKCYGVKPNGEPRLGPRESFAMHRHEGAWSANVQASSRKMRQKCRNLSISALFICTHAKKAVSSDAALLK